MASLIELEATGSNAGLPRHLAFLTLALPLLAGCSHLVIQRQPPPFVVAAKDGTFRVHVVVTNPDEKPSEKARLKVRKNYSIGQSDAQCAPLITGCSQSKCEVPALQPNESVTFDFPLKKGLCDKNHCCEGDVALRLADQADAELKGADTHLLVTFGGKGDFSDMSVIAPGEAGFHDYPDCGTSFTDCSD